VSLKPPDFDQWFTSSAGTSSDGVHFTVQLGRGSLCLPTGRVVAAEPGYVPDADRCAFTQTVPPGRYPVILLVAEYRESSEPGAGLIDEQVAAARLVIRDEPAATWEMAVLKGQKPDDLGDGEYYGCPVDGGMGCFTDAQTLQGLLATGDMEWLDDLRTDVLDRPTAPTMLTDPHDEPVLAAFTTGGSDGTYPTWAGRTANGDVACFVTDFFLLRDAQPGT